MASEADFRRWLQGVQDAHENGFFSFDWDVLCAEDEDDEILDSRWEAMIQALQGHCFELQVEDPPLPPYLTESQRRDLARVCRNFRGFHISGATTGDTWKLWKMCSHATKVTLYLYDLEAARATCDFLSSGAAPVSELTVLELEIDNNVRSMNLSLQPLLDAATKLEQLSLAGWGIELSGHMRLPVGLSTFQLHGVVLSDSVCEDLIDTLSVSFLVLDDIVPTNLDLRLLQNIPATTTELHYGSQIDKEERLRVLSSVVSSECNIRCLVVSWLHTDEAVNFWEAMKQNTSIVQVVLLRSKLARRAFDAIDEALTVNTTLKELVIKKFFSSEPIDAGIFGLCLLTNRSLKRLQVDDYYMTADLLSFALLVNKTLTHLIAAVLVSDVDREGPELMSLAIGKNESLVGATVCCHDTRSNTDESPFGSSFLDLFECNTTIKGLVVEWDVFRRNTNNEPVRQRRSQNALTPEQRSALATFLKLNKLVDRSQLDRLRREECVKALSAVSDDPDCMFALVSRLPSLWKR